MVMLDNTYIPYIYDIYICLLLKKATTKTHNIYNIKKKLFSFDEGTSPPTHCHPHRGQQDTSDKSPP